MLKTLRKTFHVNTHNINYNTDKMLPKLQWELSEHMEGRAWKILHTKFGLRMQKNLKADLFSVN